MRKRIVALALAVLICAGLTPEPVVAAGGEALRSSLAGIANTTMYFPNSYNWHFEIPLLNKSVMNDRIFMSSYVYKADSAFSAAKKFDLYDYSKGDMSSPESNMYLAYNNEYYTYNDLENWFAQYRWYVNNNSNYNFRDLVRRGQISYLLSADLRYSRHMHWKKPGWHNRLRDFAQAIFFYGYSESNRIDMLMNNKDQTEGAWNSMSTGWKTMPSYSVDSSYLNVLLTHDERGNCLCGASSVRRPVIVFADTVSPSISSVKVDTNQYYFNKKDGSFEFTISFDERIRRADGAVGNVSFDENDRRFQVVLAAYNRVNRQSVSLTAKLVKVNESSLVYRFDVPDNMDVIITGLASAGMQTRNILSTTDLKMINNEGKYIDVIGSGGQIKSSATFTDFSGNSIADNWRGVSFSHEIHVDTISPSYSGTVIESGSMLRDQNMNTDSLKGDWNASEDSSSWPEDIDRSQVYAGVGDWINLAMDFSEELRTFSGSGAASGSGEASHFTATLNIMKDGKNVTLRGQTVLSIQKNINDNRLISRLRFETLNITADMKPDPAHIGPIKIIGLALDDGSDTLYDMCGNTMSIKGISDFKNPDKQEWLDTLAPNVVANGPVDETYTGVSEGDSDYKGVRVQFQIQEKTYSDLGLSGDNQFRFMSGAAGVGSNKGSLQSGSINISGTNGATYQYQVTVGSETALSDKWITVTGDTGLTFTQTDSTAYLHLRLPHDAVLPLFGFKLTATGFDYAGNMGASDVIDCTTTQLKEKTAPEATARFGARLEGGKKYVETHAGVTDVGGLTDVRYKVIIHSVDNSDTDSSPITENSDEFNNVESGDWTKVTVADNQQSVNFDKESIEIESSKNNFVYLLVYAKDRSGNELKKVFSYRQDMRLPHVTVSIPEEITKDNKDTDKISIGLMDTSNLTGYQPARLWNNSLYDGTGKWLFSYGALYVTIQQEQKVKWQTLTKLVDEVLDEKEGDDKVETKVDTPAPVREYDFKEITDLLSKEELVPFTVEKGKKFGTSVPVGWGHYGSGDVVTFADYNNTNNIFGENYKIVQGGDTKNLSKTNSLIEDLKKPYYGNLNIYLTQVDAQRFAGINTEKGVAKAFAEEYTYNSNTGSESGRDANAKPSVVTKYTVKMKLDDGDSNPFNKADFDKVTAANGAVLATKSENGWTIEDQRAASTYKTEFNPSASSVPTAFKTLEGITVSFTVGNNRVADWGIEDIDFDKSYVQVYYSSDIKATGAQVTELLQQYELTPGSATQFFTFPKQVGNQNQYETGTYKLVVVLATKSFEHNDEYDLSASNGPVFRVFTATPGTEGGVHSAEVLDEDTIRSGSRLSFTVKNDTYADGAFSEKPLSEYTVPIIRSIKADGTTTYENFVPIFVYQNGYVHDGAGSAKTGDDLVQLKVWVETDAGTKTQEKWLTSSDYLGNIQGIVSIKHNGFHFCVFATGADTSYNNMCIFRIDPGTTATICTQEYYANGEVGNIRRLAVTMQDPDATITETVEGTEETEETKKTEVVAGTRLTPNVDVSCATGTPSETVTINVNDISSLNGIKEIHVTSGGVDYWSTNQDTWYEAEVVEKTETVTVDPPEGTEETEKTVTYTHSLLALPWGNYPELTEFGGEDTGSSQLLRKLIYDTQSRGYANPVIVVVDGNNNTTVYEVDDLVRDWDPFMPEISLSGNVQSMDETVKEGRYEATFQISEQFMPENMDGLMFYISTVQPNSQQQAPEGSDGQPADSTKDKEAESVTNTIAIPFSELLDDNFKTIYDGSSPNAPGVTGITADADGHSDEVYGCDWSNISGVDSPLPDRVSVSVTITGCQPDTPVYFYCLDELGHMSDLYTLPAGEEGSGPKVATREDGAKDIKFDEDGSLLVKFTQPVMMIEPEITGGDNELSDSKKLPIYTDGKYTLKYMDIFGKTYEETLDVALDPENLKFVYSMTPEELTNQDVTFKVDTLSVDGANTTITDLKIMDPTGTKELTSGDDYEMEYTGQDAMTATVTMKTSGIIKVTFTYGGETKVKLFPVNYIDKQIDPVEVVWEYAGPDSEFKTKEDGTFDCEEKEGELGRRQLKDGQEATTGYVTAVLHIKNPDSNDELTGTNGDLRYTFPNNTAAGTEYTFQYRDAAGNTGETTVTLPCTIKLPIPPRLDKYSLNISHTANTQTFNDLTFNYTAGAKNMDGSDLTIETPDFEEIFVDPDDENNVTQAKEVLINVSTDLKAQVMILPYGTTADQVLTEYTTSMEDTLGQFENGDYYVALSGSNIRVTHNTEFTIAIVEDSEYVTAAQGSASEQADKGPQKIYVIPVKISNIPQLDEESIVITYMQKSTFEVWAYLDPGVNSSYLLTVINPEGEEDVLLDTEKNLYYHKFTKNGEYTFYYRDGVGHTGQITATVKSIPEERDPKITTKRWWPYEPDASDQNKQDVLTKDYVNYDVSLQLTFNMLVQDVQVCKTAGTESYLTPGELAAMNDTYEIVVSLNTVTITYHKNCDSLALCVTGETGNKMFTEAGYIDAVKIIDKEVPNVTAERVKPVMKGGKLQYEPETDLTTPTQYAYVRFNTNEDVVCNEIPRELVEEGGKMTPKNGGYYTAADPLIVYFTSSGDYTYTFIDKAGNTKTVTGKIENVDNTAPEVLFSKDGSGDGKSWAEFASDAKVSEETEAAFTIYIKANEDCDVTFQGNTIKNVKEDIWTELTVDRVKGGFALTLVDIAGNSTLEAMPGITMKDVTKPTVFVSPQSISIPQGLEGDELEAELKKGITVSDNMSENIVPVIDKGSLNTAVTGQYVITVTATDEQGNSTTVERFVQVYPKTSLMLRVRGGNEADFKDTGNMSTTILTSSEISFELTRLRGDSTLGYEPFKAYIKKGMKTAGQMKNNSETITDAITMNGDKSGMTWTHDFGDSANGYYTVYIVTQDRTTYLTYLYIEQ